MQIITSQPNPYGNEWCAYDADTYDCDWQGEETGWVENGPVGRGKTEQEAIDDLLEMIG